MDYQVLRGTNRKALEDEVDRFIAQGWEPLGGVSVVFDGTGLYFFQAMTKEN